MRKPLIGIVSGQYATNDRVIYGLRPAYAAAVSGAGGIPLLIVPALGPDELRTVFERLDTGFLQRSVLRQPRREQAPARPRPPPQPDVLGY